MTPSSVCNKFPNVASASFQETYEKRKREGGKVECKEGLNEGGTDGRREVGWRRRASEAEVGGVRDGGRERRREGGKDVGIGSDGETGGGRKG